MRALLSLFGCAGEGTSMRVGLQRLERQCRGVLGSVQAGTIFSSPRHIRTSKGFLLHENLNPPLHPGKIFTIKAPPC